MTGAKPRRVPAVVVGAGGGGMVAALTLERNGVQPLLIEKSTQLPCNTQLGGGLIQAAGTRFQREVGIEDTPAAMQVDIMAKNRGQADEAVVAAVCRRSAEVVTLLTDVVGLDLHLDRTVRFVGHSEYRMHACPGETGAEVASGLRDCLRRTLGERFIENAPVRELITDDGTVVGVRVELAGQIREIRADEVILACNGFAANEEMLAEQIPEMVGSLYIGSPNSSGEAVRWGRELGAALDHMDAYQGHAHANPGGTRLGGALPSLGSVIVNTTGRRFSREDQGYSEYASEVLRQPGGVAIEIFDQSAYDDASAAGSFRAANEAGEIVRADSAEELARAFNVPVDALVEELETYNEGADAGRDRLGRTGWLRPLYPPLYGSRITGALVHTQGGPRIDDRARVLRPDGTPIQGLSAVGGAAAGMSGDGAGGYLSGNGLMHALGTGLIAGEEVAARCGAPQTTASGGAR